jgi:hypothetical protein
MEREEECNLETERRKATTVIDTKLQEWKNQERLEQDAADEERNKSLLLLSQQQQQHFEKHVQELHATLDIKITAAAGGGACISNSCFINCNQAINLQLYFNKQLNSI